MARRKQTLAQLVKQRTGDGCVRAYSAVDGKPLRWQWLDYEVLPFADFLELVGIPKGRFESYLRRKILDLHSFGAGKGTHMRYTPRDAMKILAIDGLSRAGAWDWCLYQALRKNGAFDLIVNGYQFHRYPASGRPDSIIMNTQQDRLMMDVGKPYAHEDESELNLMRIRGEWPSKEWFWLTFDVATFIEMTVPRIIEFFRGKGVEVRDT